MNKKALRQQYMEMRAALELATMHLHLAHMLEHFAAIPLPQGGTVLSYKAMHNRHEIPMDVFENFLGETSENFHYAYPKACFDTGSMEAYADDDALIWETARFGLTQPGTGHVVPAMNVDLVLVPLLAFDSQGHRLGYGKGFYDRYLARCQPHIPKIGFCWFDPLDKMPETHPLDIPLSYCVTPHALYAF